MTNLKFQAYNKVQNCTEVIVTEVITGLEDVLDKISLPDEQTAVLKLCREHLQGSSSVLHLLKFNEAPLLFDELAQLLKKAEMLAPPERTEIVQLVYTTLIDVPALLNSQFRTKQVKTEDYLVLINRLRKYRGVSLIFSLAPVISSSGIDFRKLRKQQSASFLKLFAKQADLYRQAVSSIQSGEDLSARLESLKKVFLNLEMLCRDCRLGTLWGLCLALLESVMEHRRSEDQGAIDLLVSYQPLMDKILQDPRTLDQNISEKALEQIFNVLSKAESKSARLQVIKYWYNLDIRLSTELRQRYNRSQAQFARQTAGAKAAEILLGDANQLSEAINQCIKDENCNEDRFRQILANLETLTNTAVASSLRPVKDILDAVIADCVKVLGDIDNEAAGKNEAAFYTAILERCVQFLYRSELWLRAYINGNISGDLSVQSVTRRDMFSDARLKLIEEIKKDLEVLFINLNDYVDGGCKTSVLESPLRKLREIRNVLYLLQYRKAAKLVAEVTRNLEAVSHSSVSPDTAMGREFFVLAEALAILADYLDNIAAGQEENVVIELQLQRLKTLQDYFRQTFIPTINAPGSVSTETAKAEVPAEADRPTGSSDGIADDEIRETFLQETAEIVETLKSALAIIKTEPAQQTALEDLRRGFHTLKGSGRMVDAQAIVTLATAYENMLNVRISAGETLSLKVLSALDTVIASLPRMMDDFKAQQACSVDLPALLAECHAENSPDASGNPQSSHLAVQEDGQGAYDSFISEANKQQETLVQLLDKASNAEASITAQAFILPVHTLAGSAKMAGLESYASMLRPLEKLLESDPGQELTLKRVNLFRQLLTVTKETSESLAQAIPQQDPPLPASADRLQQLVRALEEESACQQTGKTAQASGQAKVTTTIAAKPAVASRAEQIQAGFLREARQINAELGSLFKAFPGPQDQLDNRLSALLDRLTTLETAARVAEEKNIQILCEAMIGVYRHLKERRTSISMTMLRELEDAHDFLTQSLHQLGQRKRQEDPATVIGRLQAAQHEDRVTETLAVDAGQQESATELTPTSTASSRATQAEPVEAVDESLLMTFLEEADELLQELEAKISQWRETKETSACIDEILRILHTLKGSAALVGEAQMSELAHGFESFVIQSSKQNKALEPGFFTELANRLNALQLIYALYHRDDSGRLIREQIHREPLPAATAETVPEKPIDAEPVKQVAEPAPVPAAVSPVQPRPDAASGEAITGKVQAEVISQNRDHTQAGGGRSAQPPDENVRVSSSLLKSLLNDAYEINVTHNRMESGIAALVSELNDIEATMNRLQHYILTIEAQAKGGSLPEPHSKDRTDDFDTLEMESYSELQQMALSMREDYEDLTEIKSNLISKIRDVDQILSEQQNSANNLQQGLISSQMIPFATLFPRLRRLTHQLGQTLGKAVTISFSQTEDRLDRTVTQVLIGPLEHMLRNAIDHGIEKPEIRARHGKAETAQINIKLYRQAGNIVLDVSDDGAGINTERVRQKAIEKGLLRPDETPTEHQLLQFLLSAGFSTSETVSEISGRGVGLDVVAREVSQIGGEIEIFSTPGKGTTFRIHLPMTSTLHRALQFSLKGQQFVVLLNSIDAIMQEPVASLKQRYAGNKSRTISYADKLYELQYLGSMLDANIEPGFDPLQQSAPLLLVTGEEKNIALQIDAIHRSNDLIVKSLGTQFSIIPGLGGGVILGDGQIVLVLDPVSIVNAYTKNNESLFDNFIQTKEQVKREKRYKTVLVVDDSLTVRKVTSMILKRHGMNVLLAKNGLEAVEILKNTRPDVVLLDIEMPKMDGFEVASFIRTHDGSLKDLPIIMITSRVGEKHRTRAAEIGVNQYMCKPFQEQNLLEAIEVYH